MKTYFVVCSRDFDSVFFRGYKTEEQAVKDECYTQDIVVEGSYSLEEMTSINKWLKLSIATMLIVSCCKNKGIKKEDIVLKYAEFDKENVIQDLQRLIETNYEVEFGKMYSNNHLH